jgi:VCBS repeat-containing protein
VVGVVASGTTAGAPSNSALAAMMSVSAGSIAANPGDSSNLGWTFNSGSEAFDYLNTGQNLVLTYTVRVTDLSGATDDQTVTITISGTDDNHAPIAVADTNAGDPVVEAGVNPGNTPFPGDATAIGNVLSNDTDPDLGDTKTVSLVNGSLSNVGQSVAGTYGFVVINSNGTYTYTLDNADTDTNALAQGASVTDVFTYQVQDGSGATSSTTLTITITSTNDAPDIQVVATAPSDSDAKTIAETNTTLAGSGTLTVTDVDTTDTVTATVTSVVASGNTIGLTSNNLQLLNMLSVTAGAVLANTGDTHNITWNFNSNGQAFDYLADGQSLVLTYNVRGTDNIGAIDNQTVTITITGTNDNPTTVQDLVLTSAGNNKSFQIPEWALVQYDTDPEKSLLDVLAGSVTNPSGSSGTATHTAGTGNAGFVTFADDNLAAGTFQYTVQDANGAPGSPATVTINNLGSTGNNIQGGPGNEILIGTDNKDNFKAGGGDDIIIGAAGGGSYIGEGGNDIIVYRTGGNGSAAVVIHGDSASAAA